MPVSARFWPAHTARRPWKWCSMPASLPVVSASFPPLLFWMFAARPGSPASPVLAGRGEVSPRWCAHETLRHDHRSRPLHRLRRLHGGLRRGKQRCRPRPKTPTTAKASPGFAFTRSITAQNTPTAAPPSFPCCASSAAMKPPASTSARSRRWMWTPPPALWARCRERCLGCRYCMAACPYHARYFNWWDPQWPAGMEKTLNPDVAPRMRGVVEKCNFCHGRWHAAEEQAAAGQAEIEPADYSPPARKPAPPAPFISATSTTRQRPALAASADTFRLLERLGTDPKIYYRSKRRLGAAEGGEPSRDRAERAERRGLPGGTPWIRHSSRAA